MTAITNQKYDVKMDIYKLMDECLTKKPETAITIAKGLTQHLANKMTLHDLLVWRDRLNEAVASCKPWPRPHHVLKEDVNHGRNQ